MIVCTTWKWLHIFYDWRLVKTISSFWASFKLLYFNDDNCFPAVPNKNCCLGTECRAVIQPQGFTAVHILLRLFKMPAETHVWFTPSPKGGSRGCCINYSGTSLGFPQHFFCSNQFLHPSFHTETWNISGKNGTTELMNSSPARCLSDFSLLPPFTSS